MNYHKLWGRSQNRVRERTKYQTDEKLKVRVQNQNRVRYQTDEKLRAHIKIQSRIKYHTDEKLRERVKNQNKVKKRANYQTDEKLRARVKVQNRFRYQTDKQYRARVQNLSRLKYHTNHQYRAQVLHLSQVKYRTNKAYREKIKFQSATRYKTDDQYRVAKNIRLAQRIKHRYQNEDIFRNRVKALGRKRYQSLSNEEKQNRKIRRIERAEERSNMMKVIDNFRLACKEGPDFTCSVCRRLLFKSQVKTCDPDKFARHADLASRCIDESLLHLCSEMCDEECSKLHGPMGNLWICFTCHSYLSKGKMPAEAYANSLSTEDVPQELEGINSLEEQLLALTIPFAKIVNLPRGSQPGLKGPVVCVPSSVNVTTKVLPRPVSDADIISVKLKRKLNYKGHVNFKVVRTSKVKSALGYLRQHNPLYKDIEIDRNWDTNVEDDALRQLVENADRTAETQDANSEDQQANESEDATEEQFDERDHMNGVGNDTCLQPIDMATEALAELQDGIFSVALAQGNKPVSLFSQDERDTEASSFPGLFPTGKNTFKQPREANLTLSKYFNARLLGADLRFAQNTQYVFYAQYAKEISQICGGISIAMRKGSTKTREGHRITASMLSNREELAQIVKSDTGYRHFESLRGSPAYWRKTMNELFAMIRQLGLPTFFVTFSAAE
jgi:hypothetical protein